MADKPKGLLAALQEVKTDGDDSTEKDLKELMGILDDPKASAKARAKALKEIHSMELD